MYTIEEIQEEIFSDIVAEIDFDDPETMFHEAKFVKPIVEKPIVEKLQSRPKLTYQEIFGK